MKVGIHKNEWRNPKLLHDCYKDREMLSVLFWPYKDIFPDWRNNTQREIRREVRISIVFHNDWLIEYTDHQTIDLNSISDIQFATTGSILGIIYFVQAKDGRGKEYDIPIQQHNKPNQNIEPTRYNARIFRQRLSPVTAHIER